MKENCITNELNEFTIAEVPKVVKHHGGARQGAGRPKTKEDRPTMAFRVSADTKRRFKELQERGFNPATLIDNYIGTLAKSLGID